jgi:hypothetical protein
MGAEERWYVVRENMLVKIVENDGPTYLRRGAGRLETVICSVDEARVKYPDELNRALGEYDALRK